MSEAEDDLGAVATPEAGDVREVAGRIALGDPSWETGPAQAFGSLTWRPDLRRSAAPAVLHVHLAERLRPYLVERFEAASEEGFEIHVALPLAGLYDEELIGTLAELDALVHVVQDDGVSTEVRVPLALADKNVRVSPECRKRIAGAALELSRRVGPSWLRGRRFEAVLLFLLSQIRDFRVVEHNYRTDTEELDGVIQQGATQGRVWSGLSAPFILLEAKNWEQRVGQPSVSVLRVKMQGRRGSVRIGMLCGASGFTTDARDQEMRFASENLTIVFVGPQELDAWAAVTDCDDYLEGLVRRAMLR